MAALPYLPVSHVGAFEAYVKAISPTQSNPQMLLHTTLLAVQSTVQAMLTSLARPTTIISQIVTAKREADRNQNSISRSSRWPLGLLDDTRQRLQEEKEERAKRARDEVVVLGRELRYAQQTVASELAGWQNLHETMGRRAIRDLARGMVMQERMKLDGMQRALRKIRSAHPLRMERSSAPTAHTTVANASHETNGSNGVV